MTTIPDQEDIHYGHAVYTNLSLPLYDLVVTRFSNLFAWRCSRKMLVNFFRENISTNHLDVGVGTGYFLRQLHLNPGNQRLGLLDLNEYCLAYAKKRLHQFCPEIYKHDVFEAFTSITKKFDSVSLNYVMHCLPGTVSQKAIAFDHIRAVLNPGGKLFGTTILGKGVTRNFLARKIMKMYNKKKIFNNIDESSEMFERELRKRFSHVEIKIKGCVALFVATC